MPSSPHLTLSVWRRAGQPRQARLPAPGGRPRRKTAASRGRNPARRGLTPSPAQSGRGSGAACLHAARPLRHEAPSLGGAGRWRARQRQRVCTHRPARVVARVERWRRSYQRREDLPGLSVAQRFHVSGVPAVSISGQVHPVLWRISRWMHQRPVPSVHPTTPSISVAAAIRWFRMSSRSRRSSASRRSLSCRHLPVGRTRRRLGGRDRLMVSQGERCGLRPRGVRISRGAPCYDRFRDRLLVTGHRDQGARVNAELADSEHRTRDAYPCTNGSSPATSGSASLARF